MQRIIHALMIPDPERQLSIHLAYQNMEPFLFILARDL